MRKVVRGVGVGVAVAAAGAVAAAPTFGTVAVAGIAVAMFAITIALRTSPAPLAWLAVCLYVVTIQWNGVRLAGGSFANVFMALAFGTMCMDALLNKRPVVAPPTLMLCALGWLLATLLSGIFPPSPHLLNLTDINLYVLTPVTVYITHRSDLFTLAQVEASFIITPLVVIYACTTVRRVRWLLDLWVIGAAISGFFGLMDTLGIAHVTPYADISGTRSVGLSIHPNYLALGCCMAIPPAMTWLGRSPRWTLAGLSAIFMLLGGVYASGGRAGAVTAVGAVFITALCIPRLRGVTLQSLPYLGMAAIIVLFSTKAGDHILQQVRLGGGGDTIDLTTTGSDYQRSRAASAAWSQFQARPFQGVGFAVIQDAHSIYLQLLAATGVIGLLSFLTYAGGVAAAVWRGIRGPVREYAYAAGISTAVWLGNGIVDNQLGDKYLYVIPGIAFGVAHLTRRLAREEALAEPVSTEPPVAAPVPGRPLDQPALAG